MSGDKHGKKLEKLDKLHEVVQGDTEGGACLARHDGSRRSAKPGYLTENSCNHRWQGFKRALAKKSRYNGDAYKDLVGTSFTMIARMPGGKRKVKKLEKGDWDVTAGGENFRTSCNKPYWHEAHHIVPNNVLKTAIAKASDGTAFKSAYATRLKGGLLNEKYNLNHLGN